MSDDSDSDNEVQNEQDLKSPDKKQGFGLRAKKFWASATAGSSVGRKIITSFMGDGGGDLLKNLKAALAKFYSKSDASEFKETVLKLAMKIHVLVEEKQLNPKDATVLTEPIQTLAALLLKALKFGILPPNDPSLISSSVNSNKEQNSNTKSGKDEVTSKPNENENNHNNSNDHRPRALSSVTISLGQSQNQQANIKHAPIDPSLIVAELTKIRDIAVGLIKPHLTEKNVTKMKEAFDQILNIKFLNSVLTAPNYLADRYLLFHALRNVAGPIMGSKAQYNIQYLLVPCTVNGCNRYHLDPTDKFLGSSLCFVHHDQIVQKINNITVDHFLTGDGKEYVPFHADLKKDVTRNIYRLWMNVTVFKSILGGARPVFIDEVLKKYLLPDSSHRVIVNDNIVNNIQKAFTTKSFNDDLFNDLSSDLYGRMKDYYNNQWVKGPGLKSYIESYKLPSYCDVQLSKDKKRKEKADKKAQSKSKDEE